MWIFWWTWIAAEGCSTLVLATMPAKDPLVYIMLVRDSCRRIAEYTLAGGPEWPSNSIVMDAVCRHITIIGEAARRLDEAFQQLHPAMPHDEVPRGAARHGH